MTKPVFKSAALIGAIVFTSLSLSAPANAANLSLEIRNGTAAMQWVHSKRGPRHYHPGPGYRKRACHPRRALRKAWRMGVERPFIARLNKRRIVVRGSNYGRPAKIVFQRRAHCPIIKARGLWAY